MTSDIQTNIDKLKQTIVFLGTVVEESLLTCIRAATTLDSDLAESVHQADEKINAIEVDVEETCLKILALHQPVASDLRFVVSVLKINTDLERIGDLACKIADKVIFINQARRNGHNGSEVIIPDDFPTIFSQTKAMFSQCLDAFVNVDSDLAYRVLLADDDVDDSKQRIRDQLELIVADNPDQQPYYSLLLSIARRFERIADHTTNISEATIYMMKGRIIRHT